VCREEFVRIPEFSDYWLKFFYDCVDSCFVLEVVLDLVPEEGGFVCFCDLFGVDLEGDRLGWCVGVEDGELRFGGVGDEVVAVEVVY